MLSIFIGFLTVLLVLDCIFLVLLVLLQLPKKEAGAGTAFGGGATDVLFGAGTGNVLTKATGYSAGIFLSLCLILAIMQNHNARGRSDSLRKALTGSSPATTPAMPLATGAPPVQVPVEPVIPPAKTDTPPAEATPAPTKTEQPPAPTNPAPKEPKN